MVAAALGRSCHRTRKREMLETAAGDGFCDECRADFHTTRVNQAPQQPQRGWLAGTFEKRSHLGPSSFLLAQVFSRENDWLVGCVRAVRPSSPTVHYGSAGSSAGVLS